MVGAAKEWGDPSGGKCVPARGTQVGSRSGGDPTLNQVIRVRRGGNLHQLVDVPPCVVCSRQYPELTFAGRGW